jgi:hypothetical protein
MTREIPSLVFRLEPGYTFDQPLKGPEIGRDNLLIGALRAGSVLEAIHLGKVAEHRQMQKNAWLDYEGAHAVYVMGKRRSGKTYTLGVIAEGLASQSWIRQGARQQAILLVDSMNVFITMPHLVEETYPGESPHVQEIKKWKIAREQFPILLCYPRGTSPPPEGQLKEIAIRPGDLTGEDWAALFEVDTYSDPLGQLLSEIYEKITVDGYQTCAGEWVSPKPDYSLQDMLKCLDESPDIQRYESRTQEGVRRRLKAVARLPLFSPGGTDPKDIFRPGQISVLLLRDLDQQLRSLLVAILVKKIMEMRSLADRYERLAAVCKARLDASSARPSNERSKDQLRHADYVERIQQGLPRGWLIIDEAHNFLPARGIVPSSVPLKKLVNEGRNLGLSIVVATQSPSALDPAIRRNADVLIVHSISMRDDITAAEGMLNTMVPDAFEFGGEKVSSRTFEQLVRSLPPGYAVLSNDVVNRVFVAKIRPRATVHGGIEY